MDVISVCNEVANELGVTFYHGEREFQNLRDDEVDFPVIYLDEPLESEDNYTPGGFIYENYTLSIGFFVRLEKLEELPKHRYPKIKDMRELRRKFLSRFRAKKGIKEITNVRTLNISDLFDAGLTGCLLTMNANTMNLDDSDCG